jgi:N-acyl-D-aspartate/D-glutamate deacylase
VAAIAADEGRPPQVTMLELCERFGNEAECVLFYRTEADMLTFLAGPLGVVGSDGSAIPIDQGGDKPHPRHFGSFPRILGRYVREQRALTLEAAIAKMTRGPAERIGIPDRGVVSPGFAADLVVFDPDRVADRATYLDPCQPPIGIRDVLVGGRFVVRDGLQTTERPARVLRATNE